MLAPRFLPSKRVFVAKMGAMEMRHLVIVTSEISIDLEHIGIFLFIALFSMFSLVLSI